MFAARLLADLYLTSLAAAIGLLVLGRWLFERHWQKASASLDDGVLDLEPMAPSADLWEAAAWATADPGRPTAAELARAELLEHDEARPQPRRPLARTA